MAARARISAVLLAAGRSTRFGGDQPKQLYPWEGEPLVRRTARAALAAGFDELLVVVGHRSREVEAALAGMAVKVVANPRFAEGKASSVAAGLAAVSPRSAAAVFLPCDQPWLDTELLLGLAEAYRLTSAGSTGGGIVVPSFEGRRGAPVLFDRRFFAELSRLQGEEGGRDLLSRHPEQLVELELESEAPLLDLDAAEDENRLRRERQPPSGA